MKKLHLGIYGIIVKNDKILLIQKSRGPYIGKLDLPGGSTQHGESIKQVLTREILEETGIKIHKFKLFDNYIYNIDFIDDRGKISMYHIGLIYMIETYDDTKLIKKMNFEDSSGSIWYKINEVKKGSLSPFAYKAIVSLKMKK